MNFKINDDVFTTFPAFETKRLFLMEFVKSDAQEIFKMRSDEKVQKYLDRDTHKSVEESEAMIDGMINLIIIKKRLTGLSVIENTNDVIGYIGYWRMIRHNVRPKLVTR